MSNVSTITLNKREVKRVEDKHKIVFEDVIFGYCDISLNTLDMLL